MKEKDKIKSHAGTSGNMQSMIMPKRLGTVSEEMERPFKLWIKDERKKHSSEWFSRSS